MKHLDEAAQMVRRVLAAVDAGDLDAEGPLGVNLVRCMQGAVLAWEAAGVVQGRGRIEA